MVTTSAERMRWKRARDRGLVWGYGDESQLSDTALIGVVSENGKQSTLSLPRLPPAKLVKFTALSLGSSHS